MSLSAFFYGYFKHFFVFSFFTFKVKVSKANQQKQNYQNSSMCVLGDHRDGRVTSVQLGNASAPVKPAS